MAEDDSPSRTNQPSIQPPPQSPPKRPQTDPDPPSLLQSARMKMTSRDQEAMRKLRSTMMEHSDSGSSTKSNAPSSTGYSSVFSGATVRGTRSMNSTLSRQTVLLSPEEDVTDITKLQVEAADGMDKTPRPPNDISDKTPRPKDAPLDEPQRADFSIAVVGHAGVGKTTFSDKALRPWATSVPVEIRTVDGHTVLSRVSQIHPGGKVQSTWKVEFIEVDVRALDVRPDAPKIWPQGIPDIVGAILCYDATRSDTLVGIGEALERLATRGIPMILLACKSDPDAQLAVEAPQGNAVGEPFNVGLIEVTTKTSEGKSKMRNGLRWLLYKLEQRQRRRQRKLASIVINPQPLVASGIVTPTELDGVTSPDSDASSSGHWLMWRHRFEMTPAETEADAASDHRSSSSSLQWMMKASVQSNEPETVGGGERKEAVKEAQTMQRTTTQASTTSGEPPVYMSLEDLLNQLFTAVVSNKDEAFSRTFLLTYRRFCLPRDLMHEFLERFKEVEDYAVSSDVKNWALMKLTGALIDWTTQYPGDLQDLSTRALFRDILAIALNYTFMAHLTADLVRVERTFPEIVDLDQSWSMRSTSGPSNDSAPSTELVNRNVSYELESDTGKSEVEIPLTREQTSTTANSSRSTSSVGYDCGSSQRTRSESHLRSGSSPFRSLSVRSDDSLMYSVDDPGFSRWSVAVNLVLTSDPKSFATELTRMQLELFSAIRPRDVFRHDFGKETDGPVGRSISFFNHVSRWVSTLILANPKAKYRARVIERFIVIGHQLRRLSNYDTLYAVISGLQETSVHRLAYTQSLVSLAPTTEKDHKSHLKLMDPRGGYVHYRRAVEADISNGRAAIPLLTAILGLVNRLQSVRPEDKREEDGKIQWDKFARFGEILSVLGECQARDPIVRGQVNEAFRKAVQETPVISNEDGLWERSQLLEPSGGTVGGKMMKRLASLGF
ncbi:hypothetical protein IAR55_001584 [Kwoniella newhampshirensis]|uniref:Ras GEF n=1 Tax=Kwoniella newhampshirensis TaxID=1651941 RepID=A0AAW0Z2S3_9TREE